MCNEYCINFGKTHIKEEDVKGKLVIEIGSYDVNGSLRSVAQVYGPSSYIGVDIEFGHGVDQICSIEELISKFGYNSFDLIICTELLEHVKNWQNAIHNIKQILKPGGVLLLTTRSKGFRYHGYPFDFWRYEKSDMEFIFSDCDIEVLESDPSSPGVFLKARKPLNFVENTTENYMLYSIVEGKRSSTTVHGFYLWFVVLPMSKIDQGISRLVKIIYLILHPSDILKLMKVIHTRFLANNSRKKDKYH
jgi:SAM-dependent methyltransferase